MSKEPSPHDDIPAAIKLLREQIKIYQREGTDIPADVLSRLDTYQALLYEQNNATPAVTVRIGGQGVKIHGNSMVPKDKAYVIDKRAWKIDYAKLTKEKTDPKFKFNYTTDSGPYAFAEAARDNVDAYIRGMTENLSKIMWDNECSATLVEQNGIVVKDRGTGYTPQNMYIDGLTHEQIAAAYQENMREPASPEFARFFEHKTMRTALTPDQKAWARENWSAQLRIKTKELAEKERNAITCEPNHTDDE